jgi:hypothetical protein
MPLPTGFCLKVLLMMCHSVIYTPQHAARCGLLTSAALWVRRVSLNDTLTMQVVFDPKYYGLLGLRDATLTDQANIDVAAISGSVMLIP